MKSLSEEQRKRFAKSRWLFVEEALSREYLDKLIVWTDEIQSWPEQKGKHMMYFEHSNAGKRQLNRIENFVPYHAGFAELAQGYGQKICSQLWDETAVLFKDKINFKLPGGEGFEAHQDVQAGWSKYALEHITLAIAIDECNKANGALELAELEFPFQRIGADGLPLSEREREGLVFELQVMAPGDMLLFNSYIPHASASNTSEHQRRILYFSYQKQTDGDVRQQYFQDKRQGYPPDIEREDGKSYRYRV